MAVWPSLNVVNSCARATGMVLLRGMIFSTRPPMVSTPSDSGITSSSSQSSPGAPLPASRLACMAAPSATTLSGSRLVSGGWLKNPPTALRIDGMRVAPPTSTTPLTSSAATPASRSALRTGDRVFCTSGAVISTKAGADSVRCTISPLFSTASITVESAADSASLAARARTISKRMSSEDSGCRLACSTIQHIRRWSKSSPPSAESPPVASTSNTPLVSLRMEMSKVPPPRSYTA